MKEKHEKKRRSLFWHKQTSLFFIITLLFHCSNWPCSCRVFLSAIWISNVYHFSTSPHFSLLIVHILYSGSVISFLPSFCSPLPAIHRSCLLYWCLSLGRCGQLGGFVFDTCVEGAHTHARTQAHTHVQFPLSGRCSAVWPLALMACVWGEDRTSIVLQINTHKDTHMHFHRLPWGFFKCGCAFR